MAKLTGIKKKKQLWEHEQAIRQKLRKEFPKFSPYAKQLKATETYQAAQKARKMYEKGVAEGKYTLKELKQLVAPPVVIALAEAVRKSGIAPDRALIAIEIGAYGVTFVTMEKSRRKRSDKIKRDKERREFEKHIKPVRVGPYNPYEVLSGAWMKESKPPKWPLLEPKEPAAISVGNILADSAAKGSKTLFPEAKLKFEFARPKDPGKKMLKKLFEMNPKHASTTVSFANFIVEHYGNLEKKKEVPNGIKGVISVSREIVNDARELNKPVKIVDPPRNFGLTVFSEKMQQIIKKEKQPQVEFLKILDFIAGATEKTEEKKPK